MFWPSCLVKGIAFQEEYNFEGYLINPKDGIPFRSMLKKFLGYGMFYYRKKEMKIVQNFSFRKETGNILITSQYPTSRGIFFNGKWLVDSHVNIPIRSLKVCIGLGFYVGLGF